MQGRSDRRSFLKRFSLGTLLAIGSSVPFAAAQENASGSEALPGSPRWPESFRARDFYSRCSDLNEVLEVSRRIPAGDINAYLSEWAALVDRTIKSAEKLEREGRRVSAGNAYLRASNYSNRIYNMYLRLGDRQKGQPAYLRVHDLFNKGVDLAGPFLPFERVSIPYEGKRLAGLFFPAPARSGQRRPAVYRTGGADSVKESSYFASAWAPYVERGVSCLVLDAPGQGEALNMDGLNLIPDFEKVVTAAVDYLAHRSDVDRKRIGVYGTSMGGYFAGRGAAFEKRPVAVVLQSAWYDVLEDSYNFCPSFRPHLRYMVGAGTDTEARRLLRDFNFRGIANKITSPIFIAHGENDDVVRFAGAKRLYQELSSKEKHFKAVAGARHNLDGEVLGLVDWLCARLSS